MDIDQSSSLSDGSTNSIAEGQQGNASLLVFVLFVPVLNSLQLAEVVALCDAFVKFNADKNFFGNNFLLDWADIFACS